MRLSGWCVPKNDSQMPNISATSEFHLFLVRCVEHLNCIRVNLSTRRWNITFIVYSELKLSLSESLKSSLSGTSGMVWSMEELSLIEIFPSSPVVCARKVFRSVAAASHLWFSPLSHLLQNYWRNAYETPLNGEGIKPGTNTRNPGPRSGTKFCQLNIAIKYACIELKFGSNVNYRSFFELRNA